MKITTNTPTVAQPAVPRASKVEAEVPADAYLPGGESVGWGDFALGRHKPGTGYSYFQGTHSELLQLVHDNWDQRKPGVGRTTLDEVVVVPMPSARFLTTTVAVDDSSSLKASNYRRREHEEAYVLVTAEGQPQPAKFAQVVLYSRDTLGKNDENSRSTDWEIVTLIASPVENEPMDPVTMMRNMRGKAGGTQVNYTADQLLDSIDFWSRHVKLQPR
jgi:hypothetical protein